MTVFSMRDAVCEIVYIMVLRIKLIDPYLPCATYPVVRYEIM